MSDKKSEGLSESSSEVQGEDQAADLKTAITEDNSDKSNINNFDSLPTYQEALINKKPKNEYGLSQNIIIIGLIGVGITGIVIHLLTHAKLHESALFYIGLPLLLAYVFISSKPSNSATGAILKGTSVVLLLSGPLLQEGFICIIMAAPLFYIIGGITGWIIDSSRKKKANKLHAFPMLFLVGLMSLEGTHPSLTFERNHTVRVEKVVSASANSVEQQLNQPLVLGSDVPAFLKIFPFPSAGEHNGTQLGDKNTLHFVYYKHFYFSPKIGDLSYKIIGRGDNYIESAIVSDDSYVNTYLNWKRSKVSWQAIDANHTKVTWEIDYERKLDPAWYFGTLEHFTVYLMAHALVDYAATPQEKVENKDLAAL